MNITPISESAVVCSLPPPASLQQQRQLWAFANQLQSEQDIVEVVVGMNNLTIFTDFYVDFAPFIHRHKLPEFRYDDLEKWILSILPNVVPSAE